jgi:hypothetical protein
VPQKFQIRHSAARQMESERLQQITDHVDRIEHDLAEVTGS